jgi:hypothetical protein
MRAVLARDYYPTTGDRSAEAMRHFTLEEAAEALERVRPLAERMVAERRELRELHAELEPARRSVAGNGGGLDATRVQALEAEAREVATRIAASVEELDAIGVQVKDLDSGLVDFPTRHPERGETVLLCWRVGEDEIGFWHGVDEGFAGRKPLPF